MHTITYTDKQAHGQRHSILWWPVRLYSCPSLKDGWGKLTSISCCLNKFCPWINACLWQNTNMRRGGHFPIFLYWWDNRECKYTEAKWEKTWHISRITEMHRITIKTHFLLTSNTHTPHPFHRHIVSMNTCMFSSGLFVCVRVYMYPRTSFCPLQQINTCPYTLSLQDIFLSI